MLFVGRTSTRWRNRLAVGCVAFAVSGVASRRALAQSADSSVAEALFQEGRRLVDEQRFAEACPKFAESQRLEPAIGTLLNLASCHASEGKTASAWSAFTRALGLAQRDGRRDVVELAQARIDELTPKLSKLVIAVASEREVEGLEVRLDGQLLKKPAWGVAAPVDPGRHTLHASAPGYVAWSADVELAPSQALTAEVPVLVAQPAVASLEPSSPSAPVPAPVAAPAAAPRNDHPWPAQRSWAVGVGGAGVVAVGVSVALGLSAKSTFDRADPHCDALGCDERGLELRHDAVVRGRVATVAFGVGAVALAGAGVLWFTAPRSDDSTALSIGIAPRTLVARVAWR
jgi:hypothetical protein